MDDQVTRFVDTLLAGPPGAPNTVSLIIDTGGDQAALFEVLLTVLTKILRVWYSPPISFRAISDMYKRRLIDYYASFGYTLYIAEQRVSASAPPPRIDNTAYVNAARLEDMHFQTLDRDSLYTVMFARRGGGGGSEGKN
jgi:hypothetical protein